MNRWLTRGVVVLALSAIYLYGFPSPTLTYEAGVMVHLVAGILFCALLAPFLWRLMRGASATAKAGWIFLALGGISGIALVFIGTSLRNRNYLYVHIGLCVVGTLLLLFSWMVSRGWLGAGVLARAAGLVLLVAVTAGLAAGTWWTRTVLWRNANRIVNPAMPAETMDGEGDGPNGKFFPSSAQTKDGGNIPGKYFMQSDACQRCHADIYKQWDSSAHHFSSFNNQWYRKSIEYMQSVTGVKSSKWCAGCHDPALLYSGMFDTPVAKIEHTPEAQAGLGCLMCHSITRVKSTMGQADFILEYPKLHALAASDNPVMRSLHDFMVRLNPEPHRRTFLKPFMKAQTAEFCSSCHKVHLDVPVNRYRWIRGFNEYDNWQASGVSGQGARSFYYPKNPMSCPDCHMPAVPSGDEGNTNGVVHSHRFPGANTAVPTANIDPEQLAFSQTFLKDKQVGVDIFAISPEGAASTGGGATAAGTSSGRPELSTSFAVGEEAEVAGPVGPAGEARAVTAPLGRVDAAVRRGDDVRVDVVVRTKKVGHFFPGGTIDAFDVWLELQATDEKGQTIFWSGKVEDDGKGRVEPGAHFYRSLQIDGHGNPIDKRNAWATRSAVYVHLIPPGAADTAHFRLHIPESAGEKITLHAKMNYRKFTWFNTNFSFAGVEDASAPDGAVTPDYDDRKVAFTGDTADASGKIKSIPDLPITVVAEDTKTLRVLPRSAAAPVAQTVAAKDDWVRWNDYGIGLFLQGDLRGAEAAFAKATEADPANPDGFVNIGRALVQEGDTAGARKVLDKALSQSPKLARAHFFYARVLRQEGNYDGAISHLQIVLAQYPRDRVVRNELGRILFLQKKYVAAVAEFKKTLEIDPEDLQAHYNLMLCYTGLGDAANAEAHKTRYLRFKADEAAQAITGPYRMAHPEDNNERQGIHEHGSVALGANVKAAPASALAKKTTVTKREHPLHAGAAPATTAGAGSER